MPLSGGTCSGAMRHTPKKSGNDGEFLPSDDADGDLEGRAVRGGIATIAAQLAKLVVQFVAIVVLARLLGPDDFGLFTIVAAFLAIFEIFRDFGLSVATLQRKDLTHAQVSALFWLNVLLGVVAALAFAALAPMLAWLYGKQVLIWVTPVVALALVFGGLTSQHLALLRRQMRFTAAAVILTSAEMLSFGAAVAAAIAGAGLWSLVVQRLSCSAGVAVAAWITCGWLPGRPGLAAVRGIIAFGGTATAAMVVGRVAGNLDRILLGWSAGPIAVGLFDRAQKVMFAPIHNLFGPLAALALPVLSRMEGQPERYLAAYVAAVERLAMLVAPAAALMIGSAGPLVAAVLGPGWKGAAPILSWMGITAAYQPLTQSFGWLYLSQDRTPEMLRASIVNGGVTVVAVVAGLPFGAVGVAAALAMSGVAVRVPIMLWLVSRRGPVGLLHMVQTMILPASATGAALAVILAVRAWLDVGRLSPVPLTAVLAAFAAVACLFVYATVPRGRRMLVEIVRSPAVVLRRS